MVRRGIVVSIIILLCVSVVTQSTDIRNQQDAQVIETLEVVGLAYITHAPFNITSNLDFEIQAWPGNGSLTNPYMIENLNITTNNSSCIWIMNTTSHFVIQDCLFTSPIPSYTMYHPVFPLTVTNTSNGEIRNNQIVESLGGMAGFELSNCTITGNQFNVSWSAIDIRLSNFTTISNNSQELNPCDYGVRIFGSWNCSITRNSFTNVLSNGILAGANYNSNFTENTLSASAAAFLPWTGISLGGGESCSVRNNEVTDFDVHGMEISGKYHVVEHNNVTDNQSGILIHSNNSILRRNNLTANFNSIEIVKSNETSIYENIIIGYRGTYETGIVINGGSDCDIYLNKISNVGLGIYLQGAKDFTISRNNVSHSLYGLSFGWFGDGFWQVPDGPSVDCDIFNNSMDTGGLSYYIENYDAWDFNSILFENNTVNERPIGFFAYLDGDTIDGNDYGQLLLVSCTDITVLDGDFYGIGSDRDDFNPGRASAIILLNCSESEIIQVQCDDNTVGIYLQDSAEIILVGFTGHASSWAAVSFRDSDNCRVVDSDFSHNTNAIMSDSSWDLRFTGCSIWGNQEGLLLANSPSCDVSRNEFYGNTDAIILRDSDGCSVTNNSVYHNDRGLLLNSTSDCMITENTVANNTRVGILLDETSNRNDIYNNSFMFNSPNAICEGTSNHWDDQISTGNRWSDYSGEGPYIIDEDDQDDYPIVDFPTTTPITGEPWVIDPLILIGAGGVVGVIILILFVQNRRRIVIVD